MTITLARIRAAAAVGLAAGLLLCGPAWSQDADDGTDDPLEPVNRVVSGFNSIFRSLLLDPLVDGYQAVTPEFIQEGLSNATSNLTEPVTIGSSLIQGDFENAGTATERFIVNSTIGVGGLADPASDMGLERRQEDLGQALAAHGVEAGPHVVLPILGPTNFRDAVGNLATGLVNPLPLAGTAASGVITYSDNQDALNALTTNSLDPYVTEREAYEQHRRFQVLNGEIPESDFAVFEEFEDFDDDEDFILADE